jgi:hypothetical protein
LWWVDVLQLGLDDAVSAGIVGSGNAMTAVAEATSCDRVYSMLPFCRLYGPDK